MQQDFPKISLRNLSCLRAASRRSDVRCKLFPYKASRVRTMGDERPDGSTSTHNFLICYARVRTMIGSRPDGWSRIGNFHISCTRVRTKADWRPDSDIWIEILALRRRVSGRDTTMSGQLNQSSHIWTWKEYEAGRVLIGVRTCCWVVRTDTRWIETSRHSGGSGRKCTSSGR
jgi:hypothetical protein